MYACLPHDRRRKAFQRFLGRWVVATLWVLVLYWLLVP